MSSVIIYTGTFDPITLGHVDIITRAAKQFDRLVVGLGVNQLKQPLFSEAQRIKLVEQAVQGLSNVEVVTFSGLAVDFAAQQGAKLILRGFRSAADIDYELQMAAMNRTMSAQIETLFIPADPKYAFISSNLVREIARNGGDLSLFVPDVVVKALKNSGGEA
jgi:pantetheine-phosphate adenylyltransferase